MKKLIFTLVLGVILASCGGNKGTRPMQEYVSAFLKDNPTIIAFGDLQAMSVLKKSDYGTIPKFGLLVEKELEGLKAELDLESPVYFALEGPLDQDGTPTTTYAFLKVKNTDSLNANLTERGFDIEKINDLNYHASGDVAFGFRNDLLILVSKKNEFDGKKFVQDAFKRAEGDISEGKVDEILSAKGDFVMGISLAGLYGTSNTDLQKLSKDKQDKLKNMVADCYVQSTLTFEAGAAVFETKNLFSEELMKRMFFKEDGSASVISMLGTGQPRLGFSTNLDMKKFQSLVDEFSPKALGDLAESAGGPAQLALMSAGDKGLAGILSGQVGLVMVGESIGGQSMVPDFNFHIGIEESGKPLAEMAKNFLSLGMAKVDLNDKGLSGYTSASYLPEAGKKVKIPSGCEGFGKKGLTAFLYLEGMDMSQFDFEGGQKLIYLLKYATFEMDNSGSRLYLKAKDDKENAMKQMVGLLIDELADQISMIQ